MRVLFCNWVDPLDPERRGGGVAHYQRNMMAALQAAGIEAGYLSAGLAHELRAGGPRWQKLRPAKSYGPRHYEIVNSATLAPGQASFGDPRQVRDAETAACFEDFLEKTGPWDAIHFDNLEGFPAEVLEVAARDPARRVVLMVHNYYPFCPQVNLWHQERVTCPGFDEGRRCTSCLPGGMASARARRANMAISWRLAQQGGPKAVAAWRKSYGALRKTAASALALGARLKPAQAPLPQTPPSELARALPLDLPPAALPLSPALAAEAGRFAARRADMVALINRHCTAVLCVSDRVRALSQGFGIRPEILHTTRIGSPEAKRLAAEPLRPLLTPDGQLHLAYLGYMRRDKGFFFLLEALEAMPDALLARLQLTLAAKRDSRETMARLVHLRKRMAGLHYHDGYSHGDLDRILAPATLGVVPVLWEDNLPQVALEMHLRGLPLLCSDLGGAQELGNAPELVFPAGDAVAFRSMIEALLEGGFDPATYRETLTRPLHVQEHLEVLRPHWQPAAPQA